MMVVASVNASVSDGCNEPDNIHITPALALCTTHAYNIGMTQNPADEATRQLMQEVVSLKSTIITQQIYKQYEYLDATVRRLKTQLKKAVLTSSLEAAGASSSNSSGTSQSRDSYIVLNGAENCLSFTGSNAFDSSLNCLNKNNEIIQNALSGGDFGAAKRQMKQNKDMAATIFSNVCTNKVSVPEDCNHIDEGNREQLTKCVNSLRWAVNQCQNEVEKEQQKMRYGGRW